MKLLVVEDEKRLASFLHKGLRAHGYTVEWAQYGQDTSGASCTPASRS